jgi:hypothetical protein
VTQEKVNLEVTGHDTRVFPCLHVGVATMLGLPEGPTVSLTEMVGVSCAQFPKCLRMIWVNDYTILYPLF